MDYLIDLNTFKATNINQIKVLAY